MASPASAPTCPLPPPAILTAERDFLIGSFLGLAAYGVHATIFFVSVYVLSRQRRTSEMHKVLLAYMLLMFLVGTINVGLGIEWTILSWVDNRNGPGGPLGFAKEHIANWRHVFSGATFIIMPFLADGLIVYRLFLIWGKSYLAAFFPFLLYLGSTACGIVTEWITAQPGVAIGQPHLINFGTAYYATSVALNIIATILIVARLLHHRHRYLRNLTNDDHMKDYTTIAGLFVESAALYSTVGIIFIAFYARNSSIQFVFQPLLGQVTAIAPGLIILRVAFGLSFSKNEFTTGSSLHFRGSDSSESKSTNDLPFGSNTTGIASDVSPRDSIPTSATATGNNDSRVWGSQKSTSEKSLKPV